MDENLRDVFTTIFNCKSQGDAQGRTSLMMKLLNIVPKALRIYIREGVIFNNMKVVKALWRKACRDSPNYSNYRIKASGSKLAQYSRIFAHLPVLLKIISKFSQKLNIPLSSERVLNCFEKALGDGPTLVFITSIETVFQ